MDRENALGWLGGAEMGRRWSVGWLVITIAVLGMWSPQGVSAQDPLTQSYTTSDGRLTVSCPETWGATEFFGVMLSNDAVLLETFDFETLPDDVFLLIIAGGPINELIDFGGNGTFEEDVLAFAQDEADDTFSEYVGPKIEEFGGNAAYRTIGQSGGQEAIYMYIDLGSGNMLEVVVFANEGVIQQYGKTIEAVVLSAQYHAPAEPVVSGSVIWQQMERFDYEDFAPIGSVVVGPDDMIYVAGYYSGINVYDAEGDLQEVIGDTQLTNRWSGYAEDFAVAPDGTLWVVDANQHVTHMEPNGEILHSWGELGQDSGEFGEYSPGQIEVMPDGRVVIQDRQDSEEFYTMTRIQIWDEEGTLLNEFVPQPSGPNSTITGYADIEMGPDGTLYIAGDYEIWRMDLDTGTVSQVRLDPIMSSYAYIDSFAVSSAGHLIVASSEGGFYWFDAQGNYISQYGQEQVLEDYDSDAPRFMDGEFYSPRGMAVLSNGHVVVSDYNYTWWQVVVFTFEE